MHACSTRAVSMFNWLADSKPLTLRTPDFYLLSTHEWWLTGAINTLVQRQLLWVDQPGEKNKDFGNIHVRQTGKLVWVRHKPGKCSAWFEMIVRLTEVFKTVFKICFKKVIYIVNNVGTVCPLSLTFPEYLTCLISRYWDLPVLIFFYIVEFVHWPSFW